MLWENYLIKLVAIKTAKAILAPIKLLRFRTTDHFLSVNIETYTVCNRRCSYCPNSLFDRSAKENAKMMSFELLQKIIQDLVKMNYKGKIGFHHYNEPLLDARLPDLIKHVKSELPSSKVVVMSNGDCLSEEMFDRLLAAGMDKMVISLHPPIAKNAFMNSVKSPKIKLKHMSKRKLSNRGGLVKPERITKIPRCWNPLNALVITHSGNIVLCTNDYLEQCVMGNVKTQSIQDVWNDSRFKQIRKELSNQVYSLPLCQKCVNHANTSGRKTSGPEKEDEPSETAKLQNSREGIQGSGSPTPLARFSFTFRLCMAAPQSDCTRQVNRIVLENSLESWTIKE